jgi:hypothetical protein
VLSLNNCADFTASGVDPAILETFVLFRAVLLRNIAIVVRKNPVLNLFAIFSSRGL